MKKCKALLLCTLIILFGCMQKYRNEWVTKDGKQFYYDEKGIMLKNCYSKIGSDTYVFDEEGALVKNSIVKLEGKPSFVDDSGKLKYYGWCSNNENWYFVNQSILQTGWIKDNENWYYLDPATFVMQKNRWIDGNYYVDNEGRMLINTQKEIYGVQYVFDENGVGNKISDYQLIVECPSALWAYDGKIKINKFNLDFSDLHSGMNKINIECDFTILELWYSNTNTIRLYYKIYDPDNYLIEDSFFSLADNLNRSSNKNIKLKDNEYLDIGNEKGKYRLVIYSYKTPW